MVVLDHHPSLKRSLMDLAEGLDEIRRSKRYYSHATRLEEVEHGFHTNRIQQGHTAMQSMRDALAKIDTDTFHRSKDQRLIQHRIMGGIARFVYGPELKAHELEIKQYNRFESLQQEIFLTAPRRGGKTQAIAQICAAMMVCLPNVEIAAFAPSSRAAGGDTGLMGHVKRILETTYGIYQWERTNEESLFYKKSDGDIRKFHAYPGGAKNTYVLFLKHTNKKHRATTHHTSSGPLFQNYPHIARAIRLRVVGVICPSNVPATGPSDVDTAIKRDEINEWQSAVTGKISLTNFSFTEGFDSINPFLNSSRAIPVGAGQILW